MSKLSPARAEQQKNEAGIRMHCPKCNQPMEDSILYASKYRCYTEDCVVHWVVIEWLKEDHEEI